MKKCPFCKAEIEENARFCLYCMTSLEEKQEIVIPKENKKRWLYLIAAVFVFVLIATCVALALKKDSPNDDAGKKPSESRTLTKSDSNKPSDDTFVTPDDSPSESSAKNSTNNNQSGNTTTEAKDSTGSTDSTDSTDSTVQKTPTISGNSNTNSDTSASGKQENDSNTPSTSTPDTPVTTATYLYRDAKYGDDFSVSADLDNSVVITGVSTASSNGEYIIPETLDGKKVVAIMGLAFCDANISNTVKKVVVPTSVKTIWNNAFANCYNLTDIYFRGKAIYVEGNAFAAKTNRTGTLTIHCSADCSDRNYRYYKNSAVNYDALYEEWNG